MAGNADVQAGDLLVHQRRRRRLPAGPGGGASMSTVERRADAGFARILVGRRRMPDGVRHVLVLEPMACSCRPCRSGARTGKARRPKTGAGGKQPAGGPLTRRTPGGRAMIMPRGSDQHAAAGQPVLHRPVAAGGAGASDAAAGPPPGRRADLLALALVF